MQKRRWDSCELKVCLSANCLKKDGTYKFSLLNLENLIENVDGKLVARGPGENFESFTKTSTKLWILTNHFLNARLKKDNGLWFYNTPTIDLDLFIANDNGKLVYKKPRTGYANFSLTSENVDIGLYILTKKPNGDIDSYLRVDQFLITDTGIQWMEDGNATLLDKGFDFTLVQSILGMKILMADLSVTTIHIDLAAYINLNSSIPYPNSTTPPNPCFYLPSTAKQMYNATTQTSATTPTGTASASSNANEVKVPYPKRICRGGFFSKLKKMLCCCFFPTVEE